MQLFTQNITNIKINYILQETITRNDRNRPCIDQKIKKLFLHKNHTFNSYCRIEMILLFSMNFNFFNLCYFQIQAKVSFTLKLLDSKPSPKSYWSILKTFLNNEKIPCILPCCAMTNLSWTLRKRLNCLMISLQSSVLLLITTVNFSWFWLKNFPQVTLNSWVFDIWYLKKKKNRNLNSRKAHGHNMITIRMSKNCDESICKPLGITFRSCLKNGKFRSEWKKNNVLSVF